MNVGTLTATDIGSWRAAEETRHYHYPEYAAASMWREVLRQRWRVGLIAFLAPLLAAAVFFLFADRSYTASSILVVEPSTNQPWANAPALMEGYAAPSDQLVDTQLAVLNSYPIYEAAARSLQSPQFPTAMEVGEAVVATRDRSNHVVNVSATAPNRETAAALANAVVAAYLHWRDESAQANVSSVRASLGAQLDALAADLAEKNEAVEAFRSSSLVNSEFADDQLSRAQLNLAAAESEQAQAAAQLSRARDIVAGGGSVDVTSSVLTSYAIQELRVHYARVLEKNSGLETRYGPQHPRLIESRAEVRDARAELQGEIDRHLAGLQYTANVAADRVRALQREVAAARAFSLNTSADAAELEELKSIAETARVVHRAALQRYQEISQESFGLEPTRVSLLAEARLPVGPSSPRLPFVLLFAIAAAFASSVIAMAAMEYFDQDIRTARDVTLHCPAPLVSSLPHVSRRELRLCSPDQQHPAGFLTEFPASLYSESVRLVSTTLRARHRRDKGMTVAVTSARAGEGKSTTSLALARSAAMSGVSVLLVDCDLRRRTVNQLLNLHPKSGLVEVVLGSAEWSDLVGVDDHGVAVLPAAEMRNPNGDVFSTDSFGDLLEELKQNYELIILDSPPVLQVSESRSIAEVCDRVLVVARSGQTRRMELASTCNQLRKFSENLAGVILNDARTGTAGVTPYDYLVNVPYRLAA